jgi:membrane protease YdiL (CAAX protease family)
MIKKHWNSIKYILGLCVLLLILFNISSFLRFIFFVLMDISYDSIFANITVIVMHAIVFIVVIGVGLKDQQKTISSVCFFKKVNGGVWGAAIMCSIGYILFDYYLNFLFYSFKYGWNTDFRETEGNFLYNLINTALIPAIAEELLFKGILFTILKKFYSTTVAVIIASLMFAACHLSFFNFISHFMFSCFSFWLYLRSGNLILPMLLHFINNLFTFVLISDPFSYIGTFYAALILLIIGSYMLYFFSKSERKNSKIMSDTKKT